VEALVAVEVAVEAVPFKQVRLAHQAKEMLVEMVAFQVNLTPAVAGVVLDQLGEWVHMVQYHVMLVVQAALGFAQPLLDKELFTLVAVVVE
jgi:hypothetical protein